MGFIPANQNIFGLPDIQGSIGWGIFCFNMGDNALFGNNREQTIDFVAIGDIVRQIKPFCTRKMYTVLFKAFDCKAIKRKAMDLMTAYCTGWMFYIGLSGACRIVRAYPYAITLGVTIVKKDNGFFRAGIANQTDTVLSDRNCVNISLESLPGRSQA